MRATCTALGPLEQALECRHRSPHQHTQLHDGVEHHAHARIVLAVEDEHGLIKDPHVAHRVFLGALALVVDDFHRQKPVFVACQHHPVGEVDVLAVHEKVLVEAAHLLQQGRAAQHEGTGQDVDAVWLSVVEVAEVIAREPPRARKQRRQPENLAERHPGRGEGALALGQEHAVAVDHAHPDGAATFVAAHPLDALLDARAADDGVGVEDEGEEAGGPHDGLIVGPGKAHVVGVLDEGDLRETLPHEVDTVVARVVVHNDDLGIEALGGLLDRT